MNNNLKTRIESILKYKIYPLNLNEDDLFELLEEIVGKYENLQDEYNDLEEQMEENHKPIPVSEQVGISDRDFI